MSSGSLFQYAPLALVYVLGGATGATLLVAGVLAMAAGSLVGP